MNLLPVLAVVKNGIHELGICLIKLFSLDMGRWMIIHIIHVVLIVIISDKKNKRKCH